MRFLKVPCIHVLWDSRDCLLGKVYVIDRGANIHFETSQFYICFFICICFIMHLFYCLLYQLKYPCISSLPVKIPMMKKWLSERLLAEKIKTSKFSKWVLFDLLHIREVNIFDFCLMIVLIFFVQKSVGMLDFIFTFFNFFTATVPIPNEA